MTRGRGERGSGGEPVGGEASRRADRVGHEIQRVLSEMLIRRSKDPRLVDVTITAVRLAPDLRLARVYVTLLDAGADRKEALRALEHATPFLRRGVAQAVSLRYMPDLDFRFDEGLVGARRIDELLRGVHATTAETPAEAVPSGGDGSDDGGDA